MLATKFDLNIFIRLRFSRCQFLRFKQSNNYSTRINTWLKISENCKEMLQLNEACKRKFTEQKKRSNDKDKNMQTTQLTKFKNKLFFK